jgi:hypothetical protein
MRLTGRRDFGYAPKSLPVACDRIDLTLGPRGNDAAVTTLFVGSRRQRNVRHWRARMTTVAINGKVYSYGQVLSNDFAAERLGYLPVGPYPLLSNRQRTLGERLRLRVAALHAVEFGQIVEGRRDVGVLGPQRLLRDR